MNQFTPQATTQHEDHRTWPIQGVVAALGSDGGSVAVRGPRWTELRCPFHDDRTKSAGVHPVLNIFRCHACDARGNSVSLVMQQLGCDEQDALTWLRSNVGAGENVSGSKTFTQDRLGGIMNDTGPYRSPHYVPTRL